ncbi:hypothetical protein GIB67_003062 [Kingdonia uniflora]|uniref:Uncharacterized protein n=1 Tax=Kingdonia uniflora TaxID=39325 RepID=A0A7J7N5U8_9MAGN|nr:hypothetical protein GIB67_003062 [Kingdonia uniflora]
MIFLFKKITDHFIEYRNIPNWRCYGSYWKINQRSVRCLIKEVRLAPFSELALPSFRVKLNNTNTLLIEDTSNCFNFVDLEWLSSSENLCEEESYERSALLNSPVVGISTDNVVNGIMVEITSTPSEDGSNIMVDICFN